MILPLKRHLFLFTIIGLWLNVSNAQTLADKEKNALPYAILTIGKHLIQAEIAKSDADLRRGLMYRSVLKPNEGMLFVFANAAQYCFWMRNTKIPLSIAFLDDQGFITDIDEMQPETLDRHCSSRPVRYALEMNRAWYSSKKIKPGMKISGLPNR